MINTMLPPLRPMPRHISRVVQTHCYRCNAYASLTTATGSRWCIGCYKRYELVELVQRWYLSDMWREWLQGRVSVQEREMRKCVQWIREASDEVIEGVYRLFVEGVA